MIEFERRFQLASMPDDKYIISSVDIEQFYIGDGDNPRTRIRKTTSLEDITYTHCSKYFMGENQREEIVAVINEVVYKRILGLTSGEPVKKKRIILSIGAAHQGDMLDPATLYIDIYEDGTKIVEVEFYDERAMNAFQPPVWFGKEIKDKVSYAYLMYKNINSKNNVWE